MSQNNVNGSNPKTIEQLEAEIALLLEEEKRIEQQVRRLRSEEDTARGIVHAGEIFKLQQQKLQVKVQVQYLQNMVKRLVYATK
ncbi:MAG: hypothetical protein ACLFTB_03530 [Desulfovibrionales bacterium]